jgi:hypothetical protein
MNYLTTKLFAFITIFTVIGMCVLIAVLTSFVLWWLITGIMPSRILCLEVTIITTLILQLSVLITSTTKKT